MNISQLLEPYNSMKLSGTITSMRVQDVRFPTSKTLDGSDSVHTDPDYSVAYVTLETDTGSRGYGITFTLGEGTNVVLEAIKLLEKRLVGRSLEKIFNNYRAFYRSLTQGSQLRWLGPEKGVVHLAVAAVTNAVWDLACRQAGKPLWKFVVDIPTLDLVKMIDWSYLGDVVRYDEIVELLSLPGREEREKELGEQGYPAYITSVGWLGYSDEKVARLAKERMSEGWTAFKMKVGISIEDDVRRASMMRDQIGYDNTLMMDANQIWDVPQAISNMKRLQEFRPLWIEEPTSPDDVSGHAKISQAMRQYNVGVATGEMCQNRVMFKQFLEQHAMQYCQIDSCRVGGVTEVLAIMLLAKKFGVPVCPHAGGVGLCELVRHYSFIDYIMISGTTTGRMCEYAEHLHEHFIDPVVIKDAKYSLSSAPGFSTEIKQESLDIYEYPDGKYWIKNLKN